MICVSDLKRILLLSSMAFLSCEAWAQTNLTGVNTRTPTEVLDVNGTMRVQSLIPQGGKGYYYGSYTVHPSATFNQRRLLVADKNGVLGMSVGEIEKFFYMPPILLPLHNYAAEPEEKTTDGIFRINLYNHYKKQFSLEDPTTSTCSPSGKYGSNPKLPVRKVEDLEFFVIYCPPDIFQTISIDDAGVLSYSVIPGISPDQFTYVNIVFKMKP